MKIKVDENTPGYLYDLVWKKTFPLKGGLKRERYVRKNGRRAIGTGHNTPIIAIGMKESDLKKLKAIDWGQPFELYWNYNAIRKSPSYQSFYINKTGKKPSMLPEDRAIVKRYIKFKGSGFGREVTSKRTGKKFLWYTLDVIELNKFEVFKAASEAKYKKKYMS